MQQSENTDTDDPIYWASIYRTAAVNFRLSAQSLLSTLELKADGTPAKLTAIPFFFLVSHTIELFLKSALLKRGYVPSDLRKFDRRHNLQALLELLARMNLPVSLETTKIVRGFSEQHERHLLRYHLLTNPFMPAPATLWPMLDELLMLTRIATHGR